MLRDCRSPRGIAVSVQSRCPPAGFDEFDRALRACRGPPKCCWLIRLGDGLDAQGAAAIVVEWVKLGVDGEARCVTLTFVTVEANLQQRQLLIANRGSAARSQSRWR
jgi:hypothetical protein